MEKRGVIGRLAAGLAVATLALGGGGANAAPGSTEVESNTTASVPWWKVGPGWSAVTRTTTQYTRSPVDLFLVSPGGSTYRVGSLPSQEIELQDISPDGKRITYTDFRGCRLYSIPTGRTYTVDTTSDQACFAEFTRPDGRQLLVTEGTRVDLRSFGGKQLRRVHTSSRRLYPDGVQSPGGSTFAMSTGDRVRLVRMSDGSVIRSVGRPAGMTSCSPRRWWSSSVLVVTCRNEEPWYGPTRVYRWDTRKSTLGAQITSRSKYKDYDYVDNAWYRGGTYFEQWRDEIEPRGRLFRVNSGDVAWARGLMAETIVGDRAYLVDGNGAGDGYKIRNIPAGRTISPFPASGIKGVINAVVIDPAD